MEHLSKEQQHELKRQMREARRASLGRKENLSSFLWWAAVILVIGGLIAYIMWDIFRPLAGTHVPVLADRTHIPDGQHPEYNSNPPTSGPHYAEPEEWGIYDKPLTKERLVHNLEHGGIIIYYNCQKCDDVIAKLKNIADQLARRDHKVILVPSPEVDAKIVVAAWGWYDKMNDVDEARISKFFDDHINNGPEKVP